MKLCSIRLLLQTVYAFAPYSMPAATYGVPHAESTLSAEDLRAKVTCIDGVFDKLISEYSELEAYHTDFKIKAIDVNAQLDGCAGAENPDE